MRLISLEKEAQEFSHKRENVFVPTTFGVKVIRERFELEQRTKVYLHEVISESKTLKINGSDNVVHVILPPDIGHEKVPVLFYVHGGQFISGGITTHDKLIRELVHRAHVAVVFPEYSLAPESKAPEALSQLEQVYQSLPKLAEQFPLDLSRIMLSGDDSGGTLVTSLAYHVQQIAVHKIYKILLFCPIMNAAFDTNSYHQFAGGYDLTREQMKWSWEQYLTLNVDPLSSKISPLQADLETIGALPETLIITAEADVVRDEAESFARKMRDAGGDVTQIRFQGTIHNFMVHNALDKTNTCRLAMNTAVDWIKRR
ncbi:MAG: alpha/beta hydrolase [Liquorilactobacillus hordei]|uniref:Esterase n=1 Tax=Liquorilactobacillus hordei TaxID=468911 RepID=A0A3S6QQC8_9LACO|nr:alpha/beta hydrolase [Liquorilactobacillus hordei]AUJ29889.1 esterase [Liquorilactobacillus hordei]MBZ2404854.1 esterase [Liquorilactobacillus hordei]